MLLPRNLLEEFQQWVSATYGVTVQSDQSKAPEKCRFMLRESLVRILEFSPESAMLELVSSNKDALKQMDELWTFSTLGGVADESVHDDNDT